MPRSAQRMMDLEFGWANKAWEKGIKTNSFWTYVGINREVGSIIQHRDIHKAT